MENLKMEPNKFQNRLLKLYNHLDQPQNKLYHDKFDFTNFHEVFDCGTRGCAAGELPFVFPELWGYHKSRGLVYIGDGHLSKIAYMPKLLGEFFNLDEDIIRHLFYPTGQKANIDPYYKKHPSLGGKAIRRQVVANMRRFLKRKGIL